MSKTTDLTGGFNSLGEFLVAARKTRDGEYPDRRILAIEEKTMTEGTDSGGGYTVPTQFRDELLAAALENSIVRSRAILRKMTSDKLEIPILIDADRSANIYGGITMSWGAEGDDLSNSTSQPALGQLGLEAKTGIASTWVSNQLEDDAADFGKFMKLSFGRAIRFYEDYYYINGTGVNQPLGILNSGYTISIARTAVNKVDVTDIGNMARRLLPGSWSTAVWLINQSVLAQWVEMQAAAANSASVIDLANMQCLRAPVIVTEKCAAIGTVGDIILADFTGGYVIGDRKLEIAGSRHMQKSTTAGWLQNQTFWRVVLRVDGQPILTTPITPIKGGQTLSNFVMLTTSS